MNTSRPENKPPREAVAKLGQLLSHRWDLFSEADQQGALLAAFVFGADLAEEAHRDGEDTPGDAKDFRRVCIRWAYEDAQVINDVERELWRSQDDDPRVHAFREGFEKKKRELSSKNPS